MYDPVDNDQPGEANVENGESTAVPQLATPLSGTIEKLLHTVQLDRARADKVEFGKYRCEHCGEVHEWTGASCQTPRSIVEIEQEQLRSTLRGFLDKAYATIPPGLEWCRIKNPQWNLKCSEEAKNFALRWKDGAGSAILSGKTGVGKTIAAIALLHRLLDAARDKSEDQISVKRLRWLAGAAFVSAPTLAVARRQHGYGEDEAPLVLLATRASLLVLDDIGAECFNPEKDTTLFEVLDARYMAKKPTIITTELDQDQLMERYRPALYRRMLGMGAYIPCKRPKPKAG